SPTDIAKCLERHFTERHSKPILDMTNDLEKEAVDVWKLFSLADVDDVEFTSSQSDLKFSVQDIKGAIRSLRSKKS
ncbi:unnamed protein product, partial [Rotaria magnacalcarata]